MAATLPDLIDKQDNFEVVRDQIFTLIEENQAAQQILASAAAKDPLMWKLRVFKERSNPWEQFLNSQADTSPIVNVWFDGDSFDMAKGDVVARQAALGIFNIDIYGLAVSQGVTGGGQLPGDREAALNAARGLRLVRNILMASENTYLQLRKTVWRRWVQSIQSFQPELGSNAAQNVVGTRLALEVEFNEFSPQYTLANTLDLVTVDVIRTDGTPPGKIIAEADYDYTP